MNGDANEVFDWHAARALAVRLHGDQVDKAGRPYVEHLDAVAGGVDEADRVAAFLHDTIEDCGVSERDLVACGVPPEDAAAVRLLTKPAGKLARLPGEAEAEWRVRDYLSKVAAIEEADEPVGVRLRAARIKRSDNLSNADPARVATLPPSMRAYHAAVLAPRYRASLEFLDGAIARMEAEPRTSAAPSP